MRNPLRTEAEAFSFVLVIGGLFLAVALAAAVGGARVALAVFLALGVGLGAGLYLRSEPKVREPAIWERRAGGRRIVVLANETVAGAALRNEIVHRAREDAEVLVVAPALNSRLRHWTSDEDRARREAQARLDVSLAALAEAGVEARGQIGDDDPLQALEDALRTFGADEVIVSTHPPGRSNWLERGLVSRARDLYECPITHVVVDVEHERAQRAQA